MLGIHATLKRIARAVDAIPLHIGLDIIRVEDALGDSLGIPFMACRDITVSSETSIIYRVNFHKSQSLHRVLSAVWNGRPGQMHIDRGQYVLRFADTASMLTRENFGGLRAGGTIIQAMAVEEFAFQDATCPFPSCGGSMHGEVGRKEWSKKATL